MIDCIIFAGADMDTSFINAHELENRYIICADRGVVYAKQLGIKPDLIVGDFDSLGYVPEEDCDVLAFKPEKDDTDLMIAVKQALSKGKKNLRIYAALGGRLDHTFASIQTLSFVLDNGARAELVSQSEFVTLLDAGEYSFENKTGRSLSLFSYSETVSGLTIKGAKYSLENAQINSSFPIGISNEILSDKASVSFEKGRLLVICSSVTTS